MSAEAKAAGARDAALRVLERARRSRSWSEDTLSSEALRAGLDRRDTALAAQICLGVLQNMSLCDFYIDCYSTVKTAKMEPKLLDILRLSVYQIVFLDRVPDFSAVSEGVFLCRRNGLARASGLCNAVLRRVAENKNSLPPVPERGTARHLAVRYSHPEWLAEELVSRRGYDATQALFSTNNTPVPVAAQVNTLKTDAETLLKALRGRGIDAEKHPWLPECLYLRRAGKPDELPEFQEGLFYVQDPAARLAVIASGVQPGAEVLDCCAAPGGKSFAAGILMKNEGGIISCDLNKNKLPRIDSGAKRLGLDIISSRQMDAASPDEGFLSRFDVVFADVPCSGLGVIRKKPEIRYKTREEIAPLPELQLDILRGAARCVKPGGVLIYSTCTIIKAENEDVVSAFLRENDSFAPERYKLPPPVERPVDGMLTLWPHVYDSDGFFICRLKRVK